MVALSLPFLFESKANANLYYVIKSEGKEEPSLQDKGGAIAIELPIRLVKGNNKNWKKERKSKHESKIAPKDTREQEQLIR